MKTFSHTDKFEVCVGRKFIYHNINIRRDDPLDGQIGIIKSIVESINQGVFIVTYQYTWGFGKSGEVTRFLDQFLLDIKRGMRELL